MIALRISFIYETENLLNSLSLIEMLRSELK